MKRLQKQEIFLSSDPGSCIMPFICLALGTWYWVLGTGYWYIVHCTWCISLD